MKLEGHVMEHNNRVSIKYSITTLICTAIVGAVIIFAFPSGGLVSSILFIFINLLPMIAAFVFSKAEQEVTAI